MSLANNTIDPNTGLPSQVFQYTVHQGKQQAYVDALQAAGYKGGTMEKIHARFALFDMDVGERREILERLHQRGIPIFIYPHAARPMVPWDGIHEIWPHVKCNFTIGPGHVEVMQRFDYPIPLEACGWTFCEIRPFAPVKAVRSVLFGPIHPSNQGWVADVDMDLNKRTFARLLGYCQESGAQLTVRHIKKLQLSGLTYVEGVKYVEGCPDQTITEIDQADVVVGHQTFAFLAVSRGKPTLMMGEDIPPRTVLHGQVAYVKNWDKYADLLMYPLDILAGPAGGMIEKACLRNVKVEAWRRRFIGEQFQPECFVKKLESYL